MRATSVALVSLIAVLSTGCVQNDAPLTSELQEFTGEFAGVAVTFEKVAGVPDWDLNMVPAYRITMTADSWERISYLNSSLRVIFEESSCSSSIACARDSSYAWHDRGDLPPAGIAWNYIFASEGKLVSGDEVATVQLDGNRLAAASLGELSYRFAANEWLPTWTNSWGQRTEYTADSILGSIPSRQPVLAELGTWTEPFPGADFDIGGIGFSPRDSYEVLANHATHGAMVQSSCVVGFAFVLPDVPPVNEPNLLARFDFQTGSKIVRLEVQSDQNLLGMWQHQVEEKTAPPAATTCAERKAPKTEFQEWVEKIESIGIAERLWRVELQWGQSTWTRDDNTLNFYMEYVPDWVENDNIVGWQAHGAHMEPTKMVLQRVVGPANVWSAK